MMLVSVVMRIIKIGGIMITKVHLPEAPRFSEVAIVSAGSALLPVECVVCHRFCGLHVNVMPDFLCSVGCMDVILVVADA